MSEKTNTNSRPRRQLADQIDRLDRVLDGLAENLNEAVASAVQQSVGAAAREAVQGVLAEVLGNPAVLALLREAVASAAPPAAASRRAPGGSPARPGLLARAGAWLGSLLGWARAACRRAWESRGRLLTGLGLASAAGAA